MKKSKCRYNQTEREQHERAVKIRKMTDAQLCKFIDSLYDSGMAAARDEDAIKNMVIMCHECGFAVFGSVDCSYKCQNKRSPCRGRLVVANDFCPYGERRPADEP